MLEFVVLFFLIFNTFIFFSTKIEEKNIILKNIYLIQYSYKCNSNFYMTNVAFLVCFISFSAPCRNGVISKENRIYIRVEFTRKKCKTAILLYNLFGPGISFYRKSKTIVKRKPNYEIGWFHNWPMIILHILYAFHFTNDDFPL